MALQTCPSCCLLCSSKPPALTPTLTPLSLANFLPAGTLRIDTPPTQSCDHTHEEDGWHRFTNPTGEWDGLAFLIKHEFVAVTCRLSDDRLALVIRIYVIPWDLANYGGKLRLRDESKVLAPARKYLRALFPKIVRDPAAWEGHLGSSCTEPFLPVTIVCRWNCLVVGIDYELPYSG